MKNLFVSGIIAAGGQGLRMGMPINKQYINLKGRPVLYYSLEVFKRLPLIKEIIVIVPPGEEELCRRKVIEPFFFSSNIKIVDGGKERQDSVYRGLKTVSPMADIVCIHDGARPLVTEGLVMRVINKAFEQGAAIAAVPVKETVKEVASNRVILRTPPRENLWIAQTPQCFRRDIIIAAYEQAFKEGFRATDDASLVERFNGDVHLVEGSYANIKLTTPEDLKAAELNLGGGFRT